MKLYKIVKEIGLDFLTHQDQAGMTCSYGWIEWDENHTSWWIRPDGSDEGKLIKEETINCGYLIEQYIQEGKIKEVDMEEYW